ncbi:MAG: peptidylprolyl isomerase [Burkholderiaceae bacterium]
MYLYALVLTILGLFSSWCALAQSLKTPGTAGALAQPAASSTAQAADFIVAVVNSEPITNNEVKQEVRRIQQQMAQQRQAPADPKALQRQVLERLITDRTQLQQARETGLKIEIEAIDQAEQSIARQNQMDVPELRRRIEQDGVQLSRFREQLRDQLLLTRLREREVENRVRVSELDIDQYWRDQSNNTDPAKQLLALAQILVAVPDAATPEQLKTLQAKAGQLLQRVRAGEDFAALAREFSDAADRSAGGQLGLRPLDRFALVFIQATENLAVGGSSELVRTGAGFHILKVLERRSAGLPAMTQSQSRARHILFIPSAQLTEVAARDKLMGFKQRIESGQADFGALARENSQDASARDGGDLGWASPGQFVPEFEEVMNQLAPGQISAPLTSRFGVHLIQLMERREEKVSVEQQREWIRNQLREKKIDEAYTVWIRELRGAAYVEMREAPEL